MKSAIELLVQDCNSAVGQKNKAETALAAALKANRDCVDHFEQMQDELAALKARIEAAPLTTFRRAMLGTPHAWVEEKFACPEWIGKRVRLVVEK